MFYVGTALNRFQIDGKDSVSLNLAVKQFNSITAENAMKWEKIHPKPGVYYFNDADKFVEFGESNDMYIVGHCLVWHSQTPGWVFQDEEGNPVSRDTLLQRMRDHIFTVVGRYRGRVDCWDVVNETMGDDGQDRPTKWREIIGEDYVLKAFEFAREADPDAELIYNDYSLPNSEKREGVIRLIKDLRAKGAKVDGVGMQAHYHLDYPTLEDLEASIKAFGENGLSVSITELDINVLPRSMLRRGADITDFEAFRAEYNPYPDAWPDSMQVVLAERYRDLFTVFVRNADVINRVTLWGVYDRQSWLNNWPIPGRTNYPLLFDRKCQPKPAFDYVMQTATASQ